MPVRKTSDWAPGARKTSGPFRGGPVKGLLHATIAPSHVLPGYQNQSVAPQQTILWDPKVKKPVDYQHYYWDNYGKALANKPGGVETNADSVLQTELGGYLGKSTPKGQFDILEAPEVYWEAVADILGPVYISWGVPNRVPVGLWVPDNRMSYSVWDNFSGLCAHVAVPENDHWDLPIPLWALEILRKKIWTTKPLPPASSVPVVFQKTTPRYPLPRDHWFGKPSNDPHNHSGYYSSIDRNNIRTFQKQLRSRGWNIAVDGFYGTATADVVGRFQATRTPPLRSDKRVGPLTWAAIWNMKN